MNNNLIEIFGKIVRTSRDTGLDIATNYKKGIELPKEPDEEQQALLDLIKSLDEVQFVQLEKGIKYCIELSLFKLISSIESGIGNYSFELSLKDSDNEIQLVKEDVDNELSLEFWNWIA